MPGKDFFSWNNNVPCSEELNYTDKYYIKKFTCSSTKAYNRSINVTRIVDTTLKNSDYCLKYNAVNI